MRRPSAPALLLIGFLLLAAGLRLAFLSSDPYPELDWSSGLLTDESFYAHNARNLVRFGQTRLDEFNNMLLAPVVHVVQVAWFRLFGASFESSRVLAALVSLVSVWLLWAALSRAFDRRIAATAAVFLALDHVALLYHRMSLLDVYASLGVTAVFYAFVRSVQDRGKSVWSALCGALLGLLFANRALCGYLLPAPFAALALAGDRRRIPALAAGLAVVLVIYVGLWYAPRRAEIGRMTHYYRTEQIQPRSARQLGRNVRQALLGRYHGLIPYLATHTPVLFGLAMFGLIGTVVLNRAVRRAESSESTPRTAPLADAQVPAGYFLVVWLALGWVLLSVISYSPTRYYVTTYPAMASLAAIALWNLRRFANGSSRVMPLWAAGIGLLLAYHLLQLMVIRRDTAGVLMLFALPTLAAVAVFMSYARLRALSPAVLIAIWVAVNAGWLAHWLFTLQWTQRDITAWLERNLPRDAVMVGDVAAGLSLGTPYRAVNVIPGLCNYRAPLELFRGRPQFVIILDGRWKEPYWRDRYPALVQPQRRLTLKRVVKWDIGVYPVAESSVR